ncbi:MAG: universal stress protein [Alphaproteobacteria bacterium]
MERVFLVVVDDSPEMKNALYFACKRARRTGGRVGLLRVIEPADFQHWAAVGNLMREEARAEAEQLLQETAAKVKELHGKLPVLYVLEGDRKEALLKLIDEDPQIRILVLAAATGKKGPGPLISFLTKRVIGRMRIPVTIVPGGLTEEQIDALS